MNTESGAPARTRPHAYVMRHIKVRHGAAQALVAYGMYPLMQRLYWMDTWMLREHPEVTEGKRTEFSARFMDLRDKLKIAQNELAERARDNGADENKWQTMEAKEEMDVELRSPLAAGYLACITEFDKLLSMFEALLEDGVITRRQSHSAVVVWRTEMWSTSKAMQAELDEMRTQLDPLRAAREQVLQEAKLKKIKPEEVS